MVTLNIKLQLSQSKIVMAKIGDNSNPLKTQMKYSTLRLFHKKSIERYPYIFSYNMKFII